MTVPKLDLESPRTWISLGPALRRLGQPRIPGRYRVVSYINGSITPGRTLSRRGAIRTFQHHTKRGI